MSIHLGLLHLTFLLFLLHEEFGFFHLALLFVAFLILQETVQVSTRKVLFLHMTLMARVAKLQINLLWLSLRCWWHIRVFLVALLGHKHWCKGAVLHLFLFLDGAGFPLTGFLAGASALQIILDAIEIKLSLIVHRQRVVFRGHEHVASCVLALVQHLLDQVLVSLVEVDGLA